jgi:hypothetical protein
VLLDVPETDLNELKAGQEIELRTPAYPGRIFPGKVVTVGASLDPQTRVARARATVENPDGASKAEMYVSVDVKLAADGRSCAEVPATAVFYLDGPRSTTGRPISRGGRGNRPTVRCRDSRRIGRRYAVDVVGAASRHDLLSAPAKASVGPEPGLMILSPTWSNSGIQLALLSTDAYSYRPMSYRLTVLPVSPT